MNLPESVQRSALINEEAAHWVMRLDRGLTPAEQDSYLQWLAGDPRRGQAMARLGHIWDSFDRLAGLQTAVEAVADPDLLRPHEKGRARRVRWGRWAAIPLAAAAAIAVVGFIHQRVPLETREAVVAPVSEMASLAPIEERVLEDGSVLRLNRGAIVTVDYTGTERRLRLERGEASFKVTKNPARPFVVHAAGVAVRALGTEFNVQLGEHAVDVIVTEGIVALVDSSAPEVQDAATVLAGQRALIPIERAAGKPAVTTPPAEELSRRLGWQPRLLTFNDEPLAVIVGEFNRHNPVRLRFDDPSLENLRLSMRFRSDNVQGFLRLLESEFRVHAEVQSNGAIVLRGRR